MLASADYLQSMHSTEYALFDKTFFTQKLLSLHKSAKNAFSISSFEAVNINIFQNENDFKNGDNTGYWSEENGERKLDTLYDHGNYGDSDKEFKFYTYAYIEYGKHIFAPKDYLIESQYAALDVPDTKNKDSELGITAISTRMWVPVVQVTNPLSKVNVYYSYTKTLRVTLV